MKVCITEKPSVARDIAAILGATSRHDGFFEGNGYCVTWTFGHLCCLKDPGDYTPAWRRWDIMALPMIPPKFGKLFFGTTTCFSYFLKTTLHIDQKRLKLVSH